MWYVCFNPSSSQSLPIFTAVLSPSPHFSSIWSYLFNWANLVSQLSPYPSLHLELGIHWNPLLIRGKKYCKARTQAGSLAKARYYFGWTLPLSVDWGWLTAWGERVEGDRERNDVLWGHCTSTHAPSLYPPSSSSDHSEGPLSPFSLLNSWQSHSETCAKEGAGCRGGVGGLCYVTVPSLTGAPVS